MASSDAHASFRPLVVATLLVAESLLLVGCRDKRGAPPAPAPDAAPPAVSPAVSPVASASARLAQAAAAAAAAPVAAPSARPPLPEEDWVWKTYSGDHFTVLLPGEPKINAP